MNFEDNPAEFVRAARARKKSINPLWKGKSRQRKAILNAAQKAGLAVLGLHWTPIGIAYEMCGPSGGWALDTKERGVMPAYNAKDLVAELEALVPPDPQEEKK